MKTIVIFICVAVVASQSGSQPGASTSKSRAYAFGYHNDQSFRNEISDENGRVQGSYGVRHNGRIRFVNYVADENGFRADIKSNEDNLREPTWVDPASTTVNKAHIPIVLTNGPFPLDSRYHRPSDVKPHHWLVYAHALRALLNPAATVAPEPYDRYQRHNIVRVPSPVRVINYF